MRMLRSGPLLVSGLALFGASVAAGAPPTAATAVGELVVVGGPGPKVVSSWPADGASVGAGVLALKLVFDQPMTAQAWSYGPAEGAAFPKCLGHPRLLGDRRTFVLLCTVQAHGAYAVEINADRDFASANGRVAKPSVLRFSTLDIDARSVHAALLEAGLTDADEPIMSWRDDGAGVSRSPAAADPAAPPRP
jgi:hypothetical protein